MVQGEQRAQGEISESPWLKPHHMHLLSVGSLSKAYVISLTFAFPSSKAETLSDA